MSGTNRELIKGKEQQGDYPGIADGVSCFLTKERLRRAEHHLVVLVGGFNSSTSSPGLRPLTSSQSSRSAPWVAASQAFSSTMVVVGEEAPLDDGGKVGIVAGEFGVVV